MISIFISYLSIEKVNWYWFVLSFEEDFFVAAILYLRGIKYGGLGAMPNVPKYKQRKLDSRLLNKYAGNDLWTYIVGVSYNMTSTRGSRKGLVSSLNEELYGDSDTPEIDSLPHDIPSQTITRFKH